MSLIWNITHVVCTHLCDITWSWLKIKAEPWLYHYPKTDRKSLKTRFPYRTLWVSMYHHKACHHCIQKVIGFKMLHSAFSCLGPVTCMFLIKFLSFTGSPCAWMSLLLLSHLLCPSPLLPPTALCQPWSTGSTFFYSFFPSILLSIYPSFWPTLTSSHPLFWSFTALTNFYHFSLFNRSILFLLWFLVVKPLVKHGLLTSTGMLFCW